MLHFTLFELLGIGFIVLVAIGLLVMIIVFATRASRSREVERLDTVEGQAQALRGAVDGVAAGAGPARASQVIQARLRELDDLRARGVISYDEYVAARQRAIDGRPGT